MEPVSKDFVVDDAMLDLAVMEQVVTGEGHYLGTDQTLALMKSEYVYPQLGDRQSVADWQQAGSRDIWDRAVQSVADILADAPPAHLSRQADAKIRESFRILLCLE